MRYIKIYENWFTNYFKTEIPKQNQEKIDRELYYLIDSLGCRDTFRTLNILRKGANPNQVYTVGRNECSLLMFASATTIFNKKILEELIKCGANVYYKTDTDLDYWNWINKVVDPNRIPQIYKIIKKYHPDFEEERELRKEIDKYNL